MPTIIYNGYTLPNVVEKFSVRFDEKIFNFSCTFLLLAASEASLVSLCATAEDKLAEINKDFSLNLGGTGEYSFSHSGNTGFLSRPKLNKIKDKSATGTSRAYNFSVSIQLPFDQSPYNYRREASFSILYEPSRRRTVSFKMLYTAGGENSALENYNAGTGGKTWAATVLAQIVGNFELTSENINEEHEEKILNASLIYREIIAYQKEAIIDEPKIVDPVCNYSVDYAQTVGLSDAGYTAIPTVTVTTNYSARIDFEREPSEADIENVYEEIVKPWLLKNAKTVLGLQDYSQSGNNYIIQSERKSVDPHNYGISGSLVFTTPQRIDQIINLSESTTITDDEGIHEEPIWDGKDHTFNTWSIGKKKTLNRVIAITKMKTEPISPPLYVGNDTGGIWVKKTLSTRKSKNNMGIGTKINETFQKEVVVHTVVFTEMYFFQRPVYIETAINQG